jgi:PadR family transcriptional regulator, regulatory protein PadR
VSTREKINAQTKVIKCLVDFVVLKQLNKKSMHGYEIITQTRKRLGIYFGPSTIYPLLIAFEEKGDVTSRWDFIGGRPRKVYKITKEGRNLLDIYEDSINLIETRIMHRAPTTHESVFAEVNLEPCSDSDSTCIALDSATPSALAFSAKNKKHPAKRLNLPLTH